MSALQERAVRILGHNFGAMDESLRMRQATKPLTHDAPPPVDKLLPGYRFFFFSCLASFFSLAVFCGFFLSAFFVSSDLDMCFPFFCKFKFYNNIIYHCHLQTTSQMTTFEKNRTLRRQPLLHPPSPRYSRPARSFFNLGMATSICQSLFGSSQQTDQE
jgi:hypothetical protein